MSTSVYILTLTDGRRYVGITVDTRKRLRDHLVADSRVGRALRKHGLRSMEVVAEGMERSEACIMEQKLIAELGTHPGLNLTAGGEGSVGWEPSAETCQKIAVSTRALGQERLSQRASIGGRAAALQPPEVRLARATKAALAAATMDHVRAGRSERVKAYHASRTPEQRQDQARRARRARG